MKLPPKIQRLIEESLVDFNGTQVAKRAGYKGSAARRYASDLLTKPDIRNIVETRKKALAEACNVTREELIQSTREVRERCRMTGRKFRPREIILANRFLADMAGLIVIQLAG